MNLVIDKVAINDSEYREHDFDHPTRENSRHQIDFYVRAPDYLKDPDNEEEQYVISTLHFTAYDCDTKQDVYTFFIEVLTDLACYYELEDTEEYKREYGCYDYNDCGLTHKGFPSFIDKYYPIELYGQSKQDLFDQLASAQYLFYSSLKLISYPFWGGGVCNGEKAWDDMGDFDNFISNPPKLVDLLPDGIY